MAEASIELHSWGDVDQRDRRRLGEIEREVDWGIPAGVTPPAFGNHVDWLVLIREGRQVVSAVGILEREVRIGGTPLVIAGIAGVMTAAERQRRGHASAGMQRAAQFLQREREMAFALLVCWPSRVPFYERLEWRVHHGPVVCEQPSGKAALDGMQAMVLDGSQCVLPRVGIDLSGPPW